MIVFKDGIPYKITKPKEEPLSPLNPKRWLRGLKKILKKGELPLP